MGAEAINRRVCQLAERVGLPDAHIYTANSLRAVGAAYKNGAPVSAIKKQGRWRSDVVNEYIRTVTAGATTPCANIGL